jgi:long-chain acyl-CoA synthetase
LQYEQAQQQAILSGHSQFVRQNQAKAMPAGLISERQLQISDSACRWTVRAMSALRRRLGVNVRLHHREGQLEAGQIFLFNHFARFETFIPQYLIYQQTGAYSRSIAAADLFSADEAFANYLMKVGAVPNNYPRLLPFLAEEILRGRKVIVFPEGGLVKDRRVLDRRGRYSIYSKTAARRRKHHAGAAVLALVLDAFKSTVRSLSIAGDTETLEHWAKRLRLGSIDALLEAARRPTLLVPANITFYPLRASDNVLRKGVELFKKGLSESFSEELRIEGNILFERTDMDVRLGDPVPPSGLWHDWERRLATRVVRHSDCLDTLFDPRTQPNRWEHRLLAHRIRRHSERLRDKSMRQMYTGVTVNLSHLASRLILLLVNKGKTGVSKAFFHKALYLAIENVRAQPSIYLHDSLQNSQTYGRVIENACPELAEFLTSAAAAKLVEADPERYRFLPKLREDQEFHRVRLENPIAVYANEMAPVAGAVRAVEQALRQAGKLDERALAKLLFADECAAYAEDRRAYSQPRYQEINRQQTATESGEPFLLLPKRRRTIGVVLVHGFLASPAELRAVAEKLYQAGYPVMGVRLKGHGTSPWDLNTCRWQDWLDSVRRGYHIVSAFADKVCLVGFSLGADLTLHYAAQQPPGLAGVAAVCPPLKFRNRNLLLVPLVHGANRLVRWSAAGDGPMPFRVNVSEHPHINYRHIPIRALRELSRLVDNLKHHLPAVRCPVAILQASDDPVVEPGSAVLIHEKLGSSVKTLRMVPADRHGILYENIGDTEEHLQAFLTSLSERTTAPKTRRPARAQSKHPWLRAYPATIDWAEEISAKPLNTIFEEAAARFASRPCIDFLGKRFTYAEIAALVNRAAKGLQALGVRRGTKVGLCLPNTPYFVVCYYAVLKAGGTVVNYNPLYVERELRHQVEDSHTDIMVTLDLRQLYPKVASLLGHTRLKRVVVCRMGDILPPIKGVLFSVLKRSEVAAIPTRPDQIPFAAVVANNGRVEPVAVDAHKDVAVLQYTGGTTGLPKGAMLTHANLAANLEQVRRWFPHLQRGQERMLAVLPLFHVFAMTVAMNLPLSVGAEIILHPRFELKRVLRTIAAKGVTLFPGVPTVYAAITASPDLAKYDLSPLKLCLSGGASLPLETQRRFEKLTGCTLVEGYGLSESSPVATCNPIGGGHKPGSIGIPLPGTVVEIRSLDAESKLLPAGERGEICIRGPQVMLGYWQRPGETATTLASGCLHTGDVGYMDEQGYVFLIDRLKDLILCNGYNVYPRVIEEAIHLHPAVEEVTVIGVPDPHRGQAPKAFVKVREGHSLSQEALHEFLQDKLSRIERPRFIEFRDELPKTLIGKLSKKALMAEERNQVGGDDPGIAA